MSEIKNKKLEKIIFNNLYNRNIKILPNFVSKHLIAEKEYNKVQRHKAKLNISEKVSDKLSVVGR